MRRAISKAAAALPAKQIFQVGHAFRANPQHHHVFKFFRTGACGHTASASAQYNKKQSWRRASPNPEREKALNWRLFRETSLGLAGEIGIHAIDTASWYLDALPVSISGFGGIQQWQDGREVEDTVHAVVEYPGGVRLHYSATLASGFQGEHQIFHGSDAAILIRDNKGWMFKEVDRAAARLGGVRPQGRFPQRLRHRAGGQRHQDPRPGQEAGRGRVGHRLAAASTRSRNSSSTSTRAPSRSAAGRRPLRRRSRP
jgi:predicted dehydrogenase